MVPAMGAAWRWLKTGLVCLLLLGATVPWTRAAEESPEPPRSSETVKLELVQVIDGQLAAFRAGDFPRAYTFAATGIKAMFGPAEFERMVKTAYPAIARSKEADYGLAFDTGEEAVVNVRVTGAADERSVSYQYTLQKEDGGWKITGVSELRDDSLGV